MIVSKRFIDSINVVKETVLKIEIKLLVLVRPYLG